MIRLTFFVVIRGKLRKTQLHNLSRFNTHVPMFYIFDLKLLRHEKGFSEYIITDPVAFFHSKNMIFAKYKNKSLKSGSKLSEIGQ